MAMDDQPTPNYRPDIDGLRAVAVLSVVGYHAFPKVAPGGFVGVDVFFVISGYLISSVILRALHKGTFTFQNFYARRIKRIFPALLLVLATCLGFGWFTLVPSEYQQLGKHVAGGAGFVANFVLWRESGYFDAPAQLKPLLHLWSLGIEEQFYLVWPLLLYVAWKLRLNSLTVTLPIILGSFSLNLYNYRHDDVAAAFYSPLTRFWELSIGSTLAWITLSETSVFGSLRSRIICFVLSQAVGSVRNISTVAGMLLIVASVFDGKTFSGWWVALAAVGTFLLIASGPDAWLNRRVLSNGGMVFIGLISYPLYLWHWPFLSFARILGHDTATEWRLVWGIVLISMLFAWLTYRLVERPLRFGKRSARTVTCLTMMVVMIGCVGFNAPRLRAWDAGRGSELASALIGRGAKSNYELTIGKIGKYSTFRENFITEARHGICWMGGLDARDKKYPDQCIDNSGPAPLLFLWGDSYAALLYPGLRIAVGHEFRLAQYTRDACTPTLEFGYPNCLSGSAFVLNRIREVHPDVVLLFAAWNRYWPSWGRDELFLKKLDETVSEVKKVATSRIIIIGPPPQWKDSLERTLMRFASQDYPLYRVPRRTFFGLEPGVRQADLAMESLFGVRKDVVYVSAWKAFCDEEGCLTRWSDEEGGLTTFDNGHFTRRSAEYLARKLPIMRAGVTR
jgi:peptidoglycan/LPS O-acetylase OafA/YrhL